VPEEEKEHRLARFMAIQEEISQTRLARKIGQTMTVLIDEVNQDQAIARSAADAPEIDGLVYIENTGHLKVGEFLTVEIIDSDAHDLRGRILEKDERV